MEAGFAAIFSVPAPTMPSAAHTTATESSPVARRRSTGEGAHSTKPAEAYGFVGSIAAAAAALAYLAWAYAPEPWLIRSLGTTYCPSKHWALAVPAFLAAAVVQGVVMYVASNCLLAPPPACFGTITDEHAGEQRGGAASALGTGAERPIEPIFDVGIDLMNRLMFGDP